MAADLFIIIRKPVSALVRTTQPINHLKGASENNRHVNKPQNFPETVGNVWGHRRPGATSERAGFDGEGTQITGKATAHADSWGHRLHRTAAGPIRA